MQTHSLAIFAVFAITLSGCGVGQRSDAATPQSKPATSHATNGSDTVWVGKSDGAKACAKERGIPLDAMATELQAADIKILQKKKLHDGKMRIQMCGIDKGDMNGFLIQKSDLEKAKTLGYSTVPTPPHE